MKSTFNVALGLGVVFCGISFSACAPIGNLWTWNAGTRMDKVASVLEEYGTVSMSAPLLSKADERFQYKLTRTADQFFADAQQNVQGMASQSVETSLILSILASAQVDPTVMGAFAFQQATFARAVGQQNQSDSVLAQAAQLQFRADLGAANEEKNPVERQKKIAAAYKAYGEAIKPASAPTPPTDADQNLPAAPTGTAPGVAATQPFATTQFLAPGGLLSGPPGLSDRAALVISAGDNATKAIFDVLGDPNAAAEFSGKKIIFAVTMVSVNPGWRTRRNYSADITLALSYAEINARKIIEDRQSLAAGQSLAASTSASSTELLTTPTSPKPESARVGRVGPSDRTAPLGIDIKNSGPLVMAVAPMNDAQVLNLSNSRRDQVGFALELAGALRAAGLQAQADVMASYAKRQQQDISTRTPTVVVNTYSIAGGMVGIEVGPSLQAMNDPAHFGPADEVLTRQSFPVLLIIGFDPADIEPRKVDGRLMEWQLKIDQTTSWKPMRAGLPRLSELDRMALAVELRRASRSTTDRSALSWLWDSDFDKNDKQEMAEIAETRINTMRLKTNGGSTREYLPPDMILAPADPPAEVKVTGVFPNAFVFPPGVKLPQEVIIVVTGKKLSEVDEKKIALVSSGDPPAPVSATAANGVIVAKITVTRLDTPLVLELPRKDGTGAIFSLPVIASAESNPFIHRVDSFGDDRIEFHGVSDDVVKTEMDRYKPAPPTPPAKDGK